MCTFAPNPRREWKNLSDPNTRLSPVGIAFVLVIDPMDSFITSLIDGLRYIDLFAYCAILYFRSRKIDVVEPSGFPSFFLAFGLNLRRIWGDSATQSHIEDVRPASSLPSTVKREGHVIKSFMSFAAVHGRVKVSEMTR